MEDDSTLSCVQVDESQDNLDATYIEDAECLGIVRFRVSEYIYVCHESTILKYPNSKLAKLIKPENDKRKSGWDHIVIDRNGKVFGVILRLIRDITDTCWRDFKKSQMDDLIKELEFFRLDRLKKFLEIREENRANLHVELLDSAITYNFYQNSIVITPKSLKAFGDNWTSISEKLLSSEKFSLYISDFIYRGAAVSNEEPEVFRFFLPDDSYEDERNSLPKLTADDPDKIYGDLIYTTKSGTSKDNFLKFFIAVDMFLKSTAPDELLELEERIPEVKLKRHPRKSQSFLHCNTTEQSE